MSLLVLFGCRIAKADNHNVRVLSKTADQEYKREFFTDSNLDSKDEVEKFVNKNINSISDNDIKDYLKYLKDNKHNERSIARNTSTLRSFYKFLII